VAQAFPAMGPRGCGGPSSAAGCRGGEEEKEGHGEGPGPRADAGSRRLGKAPSSAGEGGAPEGSVPPSGSLVAVRRSFEGRCQLLRFRTREASDPFFVLDDEWEEQSWDELRECAEATVGSLGSSLEVFCRDVPKIL
jgi:hypothetical protein